MKVGILVLGILMASSFALALDGSHIISNSGDWKDVYSTMLFAKLDGRQASFLTSTVHGPILLQGITKGNEIGIVSSKSDEFVIGYPSIVRSNGFAGVDELRVDDANLELIEESEMSQIKNFIVVSDSYGYNAVAVAPYAILTNSWVFFADRVNIAEVDAIINRVNPDNVLLYGYLDQEVGDTLEKYNPEVINSGDRFEDNIEIVKKYLAEKKRQGKVDLGQVTLTNGEFYESEIMSEKYPILFTGRQNVPDKIGDYLKSSDIKVGVLVGNELIQAATNIRRTTGISVMVKFARSARTRTQGVSQVQGLDLFPLPTPYLELSIQSIRFNKASSKLEVTYQSKSNVPLYLKGTINLVEPGGENQRVGDVDTVYMAPEDYKTITYSGIKLTGDKLTADVVTLFGEVPTSLDRQLQGTFDVSIVNILDKCKIDVRSVTYVKQDEVFYVNVKNTADVDCYIDLEFEDLRVNGIKEIVGNDGSSLLRAGKSASIVLDQRMTDDDLKDNAFINLIAYYGEHEDSLVHRFKGKFELNINRFNTLTFVIILTIILILLILLILFFLKRRNEEW